MKPLVSVRFDPSEIEAIKAAAVKEGLETGPYLRKLACEALGLPFTRHARGFAARAAEEVRELGRSGGVVKSRKNSDQKS